MQSSNLRVRPDKDAFTYQVHIRLIGIEPPIWRRMLIPASTRISALHAAFQIVMGWTDSHLHLFERDGQYWGDPRDHDLDDLSLIDERRARFSELLRVEGESLIYTYDFGDNWQHRVVLEKIISVSKSVEELLCLEGARQCPPEDVGGVSGYEEFLRAIFDPTHEDHDQMVDWVGGYFQAEDFDPKAVNDRLSRRPRISR